MEEVDSGDEVEHFFVSDMPHSVNGTSLGGFLAKGLPSISPAQRAGCGAETELFAEGELHKAALMTLSFRQLAWLPFSHGAALCLPHAGMNLAVGQGRGGQSRDSPSLGWFNLA
jgi:hypothetical protein